MTRDDYLSLRSRLVNHQIAMQDALDAAGLNGHAQMYDLFRLRDEQTNAWASLSAEDRTAILTDDGQESARLLARAKEIHRTHEAGVAGDAVCQCGHCRRGHLGGSGICVGCPCERFAVVNVAVHDCTSTTASA